MKTRITLFILGILLFAACKKEIKEARFKENTFTTLSYNVAGLPEGINNDQFPVKHIPLISPRLNNYDIVCVQEDFNYHKELIKDNHHPYKTTYYAREGSFGDGLNMFARFPILNFMRTTWNKCNGYDCFTPKGFTYSRVKLTPNAYIDVYNLHSNASVEPGDLAARRSNILQLCNYIQFRSKDHAVIVMGDTNCRYTRSGDNIRELLALGFKDVWIEKERSGILPDANDIVVDGEVVDKIFYRSNELIQLIPLEYSLVTNNFLDNDGEWLSDHRPLYTRFQFNILK